MSHQLTFADSEFSSKRRQTRKEIFLSRMEQILPWQNMVEVIEPFYPKAGNGRRPYPLETMLRIHCMQHWYNLSDGAIEDALYEIASMRLFARLHESQHPAKVEHPFRIIKRQFGFVKPDTRGC
ncbi:IS5 transposase and trans-activator [Escherichia coli]|nr:IS5 transposase and trans-activator [Escherichia coli]